VSEFLRSDQRKAEVCCVSDVPECAVFLVANPGPLEGELTGLGLVKKLYPLTPSAGLVILVEETSSRIPTHLPLVSPSIFLAESCISVYCVDNAEPR